MARFILKSAKQSKPKSCTDLRKQSYCCQHSIKGNTTVADGLFYVAIDGVCPWLKWTKPSQYTQSPLEEYCFSKAWAMMFMSDYYTNYYIIQISAMVHGNTTGNSPCRKSEY